jgi:elongation factor Ts
VVSAFKQQSLTTRGAATTAMVKELRERTGAPMMECKKALEAPDVDGDVSKAIDWLRKKGISKAASSADRKAEEGLIAVLHRPDANKVTILEINSETDFVSRNTDFQAFVAQMATTISNMSADGLIPTASILSTTPANSNLKNVEELLGEIVSKIRENIVIRKAFNVNILSNEVVGTYVHNKVTWGNDANLQMGRSAAVISLGVEPRTKESDNVTQEVAKKLAMHIVAAKPQYLTQKDIPTEVRDRETAVFTEQTAAAMAADTKGGKKTPEMIAKIVANKVNKRLSELCLVDQPHFAEDGSPVISKYLESTSKTNKAQIQVSSFHLWSLGGTSKNSG